MQLLRIAKGQAGGRYRNPLIHIPAGYMKLLDHPNLTWGYTAEPDPGVNGRTILYPRGKGLGMAHELASFCEAGGAQPAA